jgi:hypothetical protein
MGNILSKSAVLESLGLLFYYDKGELQYNILVVFERNAKSK